MRLQDTGRHRAQAGVSLVEALVASALLGIVVVVGLTALDAAASAARQASRQSWAHCIVRSFADAVQASQWSDRYDGVQGVSASVATYPATSPAQVVTIRALDPDSGRPLFEAAVIKSQALQGNESFGALAAGLGRGCPTP